MSKISGNPEKPRPRDFSGIGRDCYKCSESEVYI